MTPQSRYSTLPKSVYPYSYVPLKTLLFKECLQLADELKQEGNGHFRAKKWDDALVAYRAALGQLPKRAPSATEPSGPKGKGKEPGVPGLSDEEEGNSTAAEAAEDSKPPRVLSEAEKEYAKVRSILNANIGACYVKLVRHVPFGGYLPN